MSEDDVHAVITRIAYEPRDDTWMKHNELLSRIRSNIRRVGAATPPEDQESLKRYYQTLAKCMPHRPDFEVEYNLLVEKEGENKDAVTARDGCVLASNASSSSDLSNNTEAAKVKNENDELMLDSEESDQEEDDKEVAETSEDNDLLDSEVHDSGSNPDSEYIEDTMDARSGTPVANGSTSPQAKPSPVTQSVIAISSTDESDSKSKDRDQISAPSNNSDRMLDQDNGMASAISDQSHISAYATPAATTSGRGTKDLIGESKSLKRMAKLSKKLRRHSKYKDFGGIIKVMAKMNSLLPQIEQQKDFARERARKEREEKKKAKEATKANKSRNGDTLKKLAELRRSDTQRNEADVQKVGEPDKAGQPMTTDKRKGAEARRRAKHTGQHVFAKKAAKKAAAKKGWETRRKKLAMAQQAKTPKEAVQQSKAREELEHNVEGLKGLKIGGKVKHGEGVIEEEGVIKVSEVKKGALKKPKKKVLEEEGAEDSLVKEGLGEQNDDPVLKERKVRAAEWQAVLGAQEQIIAGARDQGEADVAQQPTDETAHQPEANQTTEGNTRKSGRRKHTLARSHLKRVNDEAEAFIKGFGSSGKRKRVSSGSDAISADVEDSSTRLSLPRQAKRLTSGTYAVSEDLENIPT